MILEKMRSCLWILELWFWTYSWIHTLGPSGLNVVSRPQAPRSIIFLTFQSLLDSSYDSWKNEVLFVNIGARVLELWLDTSPGPKSTKLVPRPQAPKSINFLRFYNFNGFSSWFLRKWGLACENWSQGSGLAAGYVLWAQVAHMWFLGLRPQDPSIFWDFMILLDSSHNSWEDEVLFLKIEARVLI